jgi:ketosteroid isomerase-like protein
MDAALLQTLAQLHEVFNRDGWAGMGPFLHPDFEFHEPPEQPGASVFRGPEAALEGWKGWTEVWTEQDSVTEGVAQLPDGRIVLLTHETLKGPDGLVVEHRSTSVVTFAGDKILRWEVYWDRDRIMGELGLTDADVGWADGR